MNPLSIRSRRSVCAAFHAFAVVGILAGTATAQKAKWVAASGPVVSFADGDAIATHVLALDELDVAGVADAALAAKSSDAIVSAKAMPDGCVALKLRPAADAGELNAVARAVAAANPGAIVRAVLTEPKMPADGERPRRILTRQLVVHLAEAASIDAVATAHGLKIVRRGEWAPRAWVVEAESDDLLAALAAKDALLADPAIVAAVPQVAGTMSKRLIPDDAFFPDQWHLRNTGSHGTVFGEVAGNDINVVAAWDSALGTGVNIAITDDGVEASHEDLAANIRTDIDIDIRGGDADSSPGSFDWHGTSCAGMAAARGNNAIGVSGAAPNAKIVGIRLIGGVQTDAMKAQAMLHQATAPIAADRVAVNSNSWGPPDGFPPDPLVLEGPGAATRSALENGTANGRGGLGIVYVWAGGNGLGNGDNSNYDGYANSRYTIAVAASGADGVQSDYSEAGSNILVNAPSDYWGGGVTTVDRTGSNGYNSGGFGGEPANLNYTHSFNGTSAAAPLVAGVVALMLEANPGLTWRDAMHVLVDTAVRNDPSDSGWHENGAGRFFNHKYGFGRVDASAAVAAAQDWANVPAWISEGPFANNVATAIPDNNPAGVDRTVEVSGVSPRFRIERVEFAVTATHFSRGELRWSLTSPEGTVSDVPERLEEGGSNYSNWTFTTVAPWGENPNGTWTLNVADMRAQDPGTLSSWSLTFWGYEEAQAALPADAWSLY